MTKELAVHNTAIPGLLFIDLPVHGDNRGWFKESWQRDKMTKLGLPDFRPVQHNVSFNAAVGTTRGIHAEPWNKYISLATGRAFCAWVDLREGPNFGTLVTAELTPERAVFVPYGVGNSFQCLESDTTYSYLVTDHWSEAAQSEYTFVNLADPQLAIQWPIALVDAELSEKDLTHPMLTEVAPMPQRKVLVTGANGQLGRALQEAVSSAQRTDEFVFVGRAELDLSDPESIANFDWRQIAVIVNAAAYTAVDDAETAEGSAMAWSVNAAGVAALSEVARERQLRLIHVSTDYVFDGSKQVHGELEPLTPRGVYGQSKAAGELCAASVPGSLIVRTSWVVGDGKNFVRTMRDLALKGIVPNVVNDQRGRLTFASDLAEFLLWVIEHSEVHGIVNFSNSGDPMTWHQVAQAVFDHVLDEQVTVGAVSTEVFFGDRVHAPRPADSAFDLSLLNRLGHQPTDQMLALRRYLDAAT